MVALFGSHYSIPLIHRDAAELDLGRLDGMSDPERKRKIIGASFIEVFEEEARRRLPCPGHALSRRHRKHFRRRRCRHHQIPP